MIGTVIPITFEEPAQQRGPIPAFFYLIAALAAHGWNMWTGGGNHEDVLVGCKHLSDYRRANPAKLRRLITIRYCQRERVIEGEPFRVEQFVQRCCEDQAFFAAAKRHPNYQRSLDLILQQVPRLATHLSLGEHQDSERIFLVPIGGDPVLFQRMDQHFQSSWA